MPHSAEIVPSYAEFDVTIAEIDCTLFKYVLTNSNKLRYFGIWMHYAVLTKIDCTISKLRALFPELTGKRCNVARCLSAPSTSRHAAAPRLSDRLPLLPGSPAAALAVAVQASVLILSGSGERYHR